MQGGYLSVLEFTHGGGVSVAEVKSVPNLGLFLSRAEFLQPSPHLPPDLIAAPRDLLTSHIFSYFSLLLLLVSLLPFFVSHRIPSQEANI